MSTLRQPPAHIMLEVRLRQAETDAASRAAYDNVYLAEGLSQLPSFYLHILHLLALQPGERYLDISCGRAEVLALVATPEVERHGLDWAFPAVQFGRRYAPDTGLVTGDSQALPYPDASFDVLSNIGSLEHYLDMPAAVREMARVLRPTGRALVLVPNTFSLLNNIWIAFRQGRTSIDPYQPIQRYAARLEWQQLLEENGLHVERTLKYERPWPRTAADRRYYWRHPKELGRLLLSPLIPLNLAFCFIFLCRRGVA